ncbi:MAG: hypothetical protein KGI54_02325 [Pseudomonadota bacterium]|nr:hypothetical protein [Pseudomonadota bacterium]
MKLRQLSDKSTRYTDFFIPDNFNYLISTSGHIDQQRVRLDAASLSRPHWMVRRVKTLHAVGSRGWPSTHSFIPWFLPTVSRPHAVALPFARWGQLAGEVNPKIAPMPGEHILPCL